MSFPMLRNNTGFKNSCSNPGLLLDRGLENWPQDAGERGAKWQKHINKVCQQPVPDIYKKAFARWQALTGDPSCFAISAGTLNNRLYIGLGMPHVLETQVTRRRTYGMPFLPGSALKGLARDMAMKAVDQQVLDSEVVNILFGRGSDNEDNGDSGYLIFHDAWWIPTHTGWPYVPEVVTVHAVQYYRNQGKNAPHPDLETPNPNQQISVQGSFYFVVEGKQPWADLGMRLLQKGLEEEGIGGKVDSGYGYFSFPGAEKEIIRQAGNMHRKHIQAQQQWLQQYRRQSEIAREKKITDSLPPREQLVRKLEEAVTAGESKPGCMKKDDINQLVNKIIRDHGWPPAERKMVLPLIERAYALTVPARKRKKKLQKVQACGQGSPKQ